MPDVVKKQTIKQAKASFKARGKPVLSEKQSRQLERDIELQRRADRIKDAETRRAENAKKNSEKRARELASKPRVQLSSQRRCDRFGYKSSQFHIGAFFHQKPVGMTRNQDEPVAARDEDAFDDDDLDDNSLLEALESPAKATSAPLESKSEAVLMPPPPLPAPVCPRTKHTLPPTEDLSGFFEELCSSTQIARELDDDLPPPRASIDSRHSSFSSGSLDLSMQDLEEMDPPKPAPCRPTPTTCPSPITAARIHSPPDTAGGPSSQKSSGSSGSFDFTEDDLNMLDPPKQPWKPKWAAPSAQDDSQKTLTVTSSNIGRLAQSRSRETSTSSRGTGSVMSNSRTPTFSPAAGIQSKMAPPAMPKRHLGPVLPRLPYGRMTGATRHRPAAIGSPFLSASSLYCATEHGFTMTQLESFVDDDIQLTQVVPS